jgi:D-alanyl-D-alanine carboxypeptidase (penicillin-binding protein 5/6)
MAARGLPRSPKRRALKLRNIHRLRFAAWAALGILTGVVASAYAAPNPASGPRTANPVSGPTKSGDGFQTPAAHAILIEADSGSVLFEKAADDLIPPASLSKLMTAEVVFNELKQGRLKPTTEFSVSTNAWRKGGAPSRTSAMFLSIHSKVAIDDLLHGVIIQSGNDACIVLAEGISGSENEFAEMMTKRAREIGLAKSTFGEMAEGTLTARCLAKPETPTTCYGP